MRIQLIKWILLLLPMPSLASRAKSDLPTMGAFANNLMAPVDFMADFIEPACFMIGFSFAIASLIKYLDMKKNPEKQQLGTVFFLLIGGIILMLFPVLALFLERGLSHV